MIKYVINFNWSGKTFRYIKERPNRPERWYHWSYPTLSGHVHLVKNDCTFDTKEDAQAFADTIRDDAQKALDSHVKEFGVVKRDGWEYNQRRTIKRFTEASRYTIDEYEPDFVFKKERKTGNRGWKKTTGPNQFCHLCGTNILTEKYLQVGQSRVCPFCIKRLATEGQQFIDELKKETPDIEDHHMNTTFLGHME